jgi:hypothetical protein
VGDIVFDFLPPLLLHLLFVAPAETAYI